MSLIRLRSSRVRGLLAALSLAGCFIAPRVASGAASAAAVTGSSVDHDVVEMAFNAASCAVQSGTVARPRTLTVIDYSKPSTARRLWVFDATTHQLLYEELVAHGQGTGDNLAAMFSNQPETHRSSVGLFVTGEAYTGKNGYSLRLDGLEPGFNDNARARAIVVHGAPYVNETFANAHGRLGRSWGCPAVSDAVARSLIDHIKGGGLVFAYYPDQDWLKTSKFVSCSTAH
jgi:hypothetical protein